MQRNDRSTARAKRYSFVLWCLLGLFCARVLGQILVAFAGVTFLPAMEEWMSGAVGYPFLLTSQILIIALLTTIAWQFRKGQGWFARPNGKLGIGLAWFGGVYLTVMVIRYVTRMSLYPPERWIGGSIPTIFHWVLASYVLTVARYHLLEASPPKGPLWRRGLGVTFLSILITGWVGYLIAPTVLAKGLGYGMPLNAVRTDRSVGLSTSDGIRLVADVYRPVHVGKVPTVLVRLPYSKTIENRIAATLVGRMWAERGYNVVIQGVRGRYESGGTHHPLVHERQDGIETLKWLKDQPWFDGRLGMWGGSYFGYTQWVLADQRSPGPSVLNIQLASTSFHDMLFPGGAFAVESGLYWGLRSGGTEDVPVTGKELDRGYGSFPVVDAAKRAGKDVGFFREWVTHPDRNDEYWQAIDGDRRAQNLRIPALLMGGWFDPFLPSLLSDFQEAPLGTETRLVIGPWAHAWSPELPDGFQPDNYRLESLRPALDWFDLHLRKVKVKPFPPVRLFVMGDNRWRNEEEWPLARAQYKPHYFSANSLVEDRPQQSKQTYRFDPNNPVRSRGGSMLGPRAGPRLQDLKDRSDVLEFTGSPLSHEMEITGPIKAILYVHTTVPSTDFTVWLLDVHPDGRAFNLSEGILRQNYTKSAKAARIEVEMQPTSIVLPAGHRLRVHVSSSSYPRWDVNPNTGRNIATETIGVPADQTLFLGGPTGSCIVLPVIPRDPEIDR